MSSRTPHRDPASAGVDPVILELVRTGLVAITDEMKSNLKRTAFNPIIYEAGDFTVGLFDRQGRTVSIGLGLPMFVLGLSDAIQAKLEHYGLDGIEPGDVLLTNDSYIMGSHLNHITLTLPIFWEGRIVAFASSMAHWQDIGGVLGGRTTDIYSEGLQLPIVKVEKAGRPDNEILSIIAMNVRQPERAMGDYRAQMAAIRTGERRFVELVQRHGIDAVLGAIEHIYDRSERQARQAVEAIPDGVYEADAFMDDDGVTDEPVEIAVCVVVAGDRMTVDFSRVNAQVTGYFNSGATAGRSAAQVAFKFLTTPDLFPINEGSFRSLDIVLPAGTVISATRPAATRWWMTVPMTVVDAIFKALAPVVPERVPAGHHADLGAVYCYGTDPRTGQFFLGLSGAPGGGWGAKHHEDGVSATVCVNDGDTHNTPVEATESRLPILMERYELRPDSGGPGRFRGGLGTHRRVRVLTDCQMNAQVERTRCAPWGLLGGLPGAANRVYVERADGTRIDPPNGKIDSLPLQRGDTYGVALGGGGGFHDPFERDPERVLADVRSGYVSVEAAGRDYGVVVRAGADGGLVVDADATVALRTGDPR